MAPAEVPATSELETARATARDMLANATPVSAPTADYGATLFSHR